MAGGPRILIVEARFYEDIADHLVKGAVQELTAQGAGYKRVIVPGVMEIPAVIRFAIRAMELRATDTRFAGYVALGCVIRGETDHYHWVSKGAMDGIQNLSLQYSLAVGNGILTVEDKAQALDRARVDGKNLGGKAAKAALRMIDIKRELGL